MLPFGADVDACPAGDEQPVHHNHLAQGDSQPVGQRRLGRDRRQRSEVGQRLAALLSALGTHFKRFVRDFRRSKRLFGNSAAFSAFRRAFQRCVQGRTQTTNGQAPKAIQIKHA